MRNWIVGLFLSFSFLNCAPTSSIKQNPSIRFQQEIEENDPTEARRMKAVLGTEPDVKLAMRVVRENKSGVYMFNMHDAQTHEPILVALYHGTKTTHQQHEHQLKLFGVIASHLGIRLVVIACNPRMMPVSTAHLSIFPGHKGPLWAGTDGHNTFGVATHRPGHVQQQHQGEDDLIVLK